ncbi:MAG: DUF177 domain-containing protein [Chloroflexi bacterium]|nr:DUF177 domain-containing protein [Chloroflexota bacterium]
MTGLQFNVAGFLKELAGAAREYDVDAPPEALAPLVEEVRPVQRLLGHVRMMRTPRSIFARGRFRTRVEVECSRCLTEAEVPIEFEIDAEFYPLVDIETGHYLPEPEDDLGFTIDASHEIDLSEAVRQHILLEVPMQTICSESCKGLCPQCGVNQNEIECVCEEETVDPQMSRLRELLERNAGG